MSAQALEAHSPETSQAKTVPSTPPSPPSIPESWRPRGKSLEASPESLARTVPTDLPDAGSLPQSVAAPRHPAPPHPASHGRPPPCLRFRLSLLDGHTPIHLYLPCCASRRLCRVPPRFLIPIFQRSFTSHSTSTVARRQSLGYLNPSW